MPFKNAMVKFFATSPWGIILLTFFPAAVLSAMIFPEFLIYHNCEFLTKDFIADYWGSFTLTNFFYQGGIQLWDPYDQMPLSYYCLTVGIYKFFNVITALIYVVFSPFSAFQAEFFNAVFGPTCFLSNLFLKIVGSYLLFKKFSSDRLTVSLASIYSSVILSSQFYFSGLSYNSYVPLLIYFTLNVFEHFRLKDIFLWCVFFCICLADNVLHTAYLYQGIHFMVLACIVWVVARKKPAHRQRHKVNWKAIVLTTVVCLMLVAPVICLLKNLAGDMDFGEGTRIDRLWNWHAYFTRDMSFGPPPEFLSSFVDYFRKQSWVCVGYGVIFFALFGLVTSRDSRKYVILTPIIFVWMLNHPRESFPFGALAHTLNFLTNPLSFSVRDFQELQMNFLPVWLMSLAVIGIESLRGHLRVVPLRLLFLLLSLVLFLAIAAPKLSAAARFYCFLQFFISLVFGYFYFFRHHRPRFLRVVLGVFILIDMAAMSYYVRTSMNPSGSAYPHAIEGKPELGLVGVDYQNPRILPYREHFDLFVYRHINSYLFDRVLNMPGVFYRYTNFSRNFLPSQIMPKHKSYASWSVDNGYMKQYLSRDTHFIVSGDDAVKRFDGSFDITPAVEKKRPLEYLLLDPVRIPSFWSFIKDGYIYTQFQLPKLTFRETDGQFPKLTFREADGQFPKDFLQKYFATTFLTEDQDNLQFYVANKDGRAGRLTPVQGQIVRPWTFDYNNIREGLFTAAFLPQDYPTGGKFVIAAPSPPQEGVVKIWKWQFDNLGFDYVTHRGRWLVLHYPYDLKWRITVDGAKQPFYRVNKSFIGFPVQEGKHHILVQYWPGTPLRWLLLISTVVAFVSLIGLIHYALRDH